MTPDRQTRNVVVTGATRGIGRAVVELMAAHGWTVWALGRNTKLLREMEKPAVVNTARVDVADEAAVAGFFSECAAQDLSFDALINNAGVMGGGPIQQQTLGEFSRFLEVNVVGAWLMIKHALPLLSSRSSIVNVGSVASVAGYANRAAYCASKHALSGMTKALAVELSPSGVRVNLLCLGSFDTPGLNELAASNPEGVKGFADRQLLGRLGDPEEAAAACAFLASSQSSFMTGSIMTVDGGMLTKGASG